MKTQAAIQSFLNNCRARNLSPYSILFYQSRLNTFARHFPKLPKRPEEVEEFLTGLTVSPETRYACFKTLKVFYCFTNQRHGVPNPMKHIAPPLRPKKIMPTLEPRQIMELINSASNLRDKALVTLFVDTGARLGEIGGLRPQDIGGDIIKVNGKTGEREIPISEETRRLLLALIAANGKGDYIFNSRLGRPLDRNSIYFIIRSLMRKAGIQEPKLGPHRIRHAFGKGYLVNGGDIRSLQEIMGHASITTTQKYASLNLSDVITKHHRFTLLRAAHAAAQESFLDKVNAVEEAEAILEKRR